MRVKCPNSDIVLELPGDKTDMKFTCPACHKIHRVTVSITTPGDAPPANPVARSVAAMPKKYATGAYAPVVDVPIDANFVLIDGAAGAQGIDLGAAAPKAAPRAPEQDAAFFSRKTESVRREAPAPEVPPAPAEPPEETERKKQLSDSGRMMWDDILPSAEKKKSGEPPAAANGSDTVDDDSGIDEDDYEADRRPERGENTGGGIVKGILFLILLAALAAAAYLGYQQYTYGNARRLVEDFLGRAENSWRQGDIPGSAGAAREAQVVLDNSADILTPRRAYNRLASATGAVAPLAEAEDAAAAGERIRGYVAREDRLRAFVDGLDASSAAGMAEQLRGAAASAAGDAPLAEAMERAAVSAAVSGLDAGAEEMPPEAARARARADAAALAPVLSEAGRRALEDGLSGFLERQKRRLTAEVKDEIARIARDAGRGEEEALTRYRALADRVRGADIPEFGAAVAELGDDADRAALEQLAELSAVVDEAVSHARSALSREEEDGDGDGDGFVDGLVEKARGIAEPNPAMASAAADLVEDTRAAADDLLSLRVEVYSRMQSELRRNREYAGTRLAWAMLRTGFADPQVRIDPKGFKFDSSSGTMRFDFGGLPGVMAMTEDDYEKRVRATMNGYSFTAGWALLFHKPVSWMAGLARGMRAANVDPDRYPAWEVIEGPEGPLALSVSGVAANGANASLGGAPERAIFFDGRLLPVAELPRPENAEGAAEDFRLAARALEDAVMADGGISQQLRQALRPVLAGTYSKPDPRDYFDSAFCRRLIEADYLETYIEPMPQAVQSALENFRAALERLESGYDEFSADLGGGRVLFAGVRPDGGGGDGDRGNAGDQDPETGETLPRYAWRVEGADTTVFHSPLPARFVYSFMLAEHYDGRHARRPAGVPSLTEVRHATKGIIASYRDGAARAEGDEDRWNDAVEEDGSGRFDPSAGPAGWNYPLHVLQRDDQGDPVLLATLSGVVRSPDFSGVVEEAERRREEEAWLDGTAETLSTPGELGLIFHQFFRYCSDSPLPELPNVIGSHVGLSDTHQTVYESLERRWVGRLIGDCDDLAEFFQVLTRRQGKLSHVMQLPGHAAAGYVEKTEDGNSFRFVVLQTGPVMQFVAPTLNDAVEFAYRSFDRGDGMSHMTVDAVPLLLRFANEETRTPFVLSARIFEDAEYADTMIRVQSYWHEYVFSAAIATMEDLVEEDKEIGNIKELGSLYERVGFYDKSERLRREELEMVRDNPQAALSTLLEIVQLHFQDKNRDKALAALGEMEELMLRMIRNEDAPEFFRNMTFRSYWAMFLSRLGQPERAWQLVRYDVTMTKRQLGRVAEPVLRTLVLMYDRMCLERDRAGGTVSADAATALEEVRGELEEAFRRGYFTADDSYNSVIGKYFFMGRFAVADAGREQGLAELRKDGPYPAQPKDQTKRSRGIGGEDWNWFRITPQLYHALGTEMLDRAEYPELYDPVAARPILEDVARAVDRGTGLGSDVAGADNAVTAGLTLSFLNNDLAAFRRAMSVVLEKDYSSLYDEAALTFGAYCGLVPLADFPAWAEAFREFFPGRQHYFKVVYRAIDKEYYDHALVMAEATARFFPENAMLREEADFVRFIIPDLKSRKATRQWRERAE